MRSRAWAAAGLAGATAVVVLGVVQSHSSGREGPAQGRVPLVAAVEPRPAAFVDEDTGQTVVVSVVPVWDDTSRASAVRAGTAVIQRFAQPAKVDGRRRWWGLLEPLLTPRARLDFAGVDPRNVPVRSVRGAAQLVDDTSVYVAKVKVPTDAGTYVVMLSRTAAGAAWLADDLVPPDRQR